MSRARRGCESYVSLPALSRRQFLRAGVLGGLGLSLADVLRSEALAAPTNPLPTAKSVILLWLQGGVSHHETFDPKPDAPADIRGEMKAIATRLPGVHVNEYLPKLAGIMDKLAVIRSVTHVEAAHERGSMYMVEGRRPPLATATMNSGHPELGSIVAQQLGMRDGVPPFVSVPGNDFTSRFIGPGFLPRATGSFGGHRAKSLQPNEEISSDRFADRLALRNAFERGEAGQLLAQGETGSWDRFNERALDVLASGKAAAAFDLDKESAETKKRYGLASGKRDDMASFTLTARRLVEAGVRFVTVGRDSWDHHDNIFPQLKGRLPGFDTAFSALVEDLQTRGMLDETLVVYMTEYGRTPRVNAKAGRDHWPSAFSIAFAGAGIKPGQVIGASDATGAAVKERPVSPEEIAATILHLVGVHPQQEFVRPDGRPVTFVDEARPLAPLLK